jgi:mannosyltransferase
LGVWKTRNQNFIQLLIVCAILPPILLFIVSYLMRPVFVPRGLIFSLLAYNCLVGIVISRSFPHGIGSLLLGLGIVAAVISLPFQYTYNQFPRSPFRSGCEFLAQKVNSDDIVVHDNKLSFFPCKYYQPGLQQEFIRDEALSQNDTLAYPTQVALGLFPKDDIQKAIAGKDKVYFVVFEETIREYQNLGGKEHPQLSWLKENLRFAEMIPFKDLQIYQFVR